MAEKTLTPQRVTVIFDGTCGFCTRWIRYLKKIDKRDQVTVIPCQIAQQDPVYRLQNIDCGESAWALTEDGRREAGAQAATLIFSVLMDKRWPVTVGRIAGIRHVLAGGYRVIAKNRYRFPGDTPYCNVPGNDCGTAADASCGTP